MVHDVKNGSDLCEANSSNLGSQTIALLYAIEWLLYIVSFFSLSRWVPLGGFDSLCLQMCCVYQVAILTEV